MVHHVAATFCLRCCSETPGETTPAREEANDRVGEDGAVLFCGVVLATAVLNEPVLTEALHTSIRAGAIA